MTASASRAGTVVVPAHDEEPVIARCLAVLLDGAAPGEFPVVVVVNGSTDRTAEVARRVPGRGVSGRTGRR